MVAKFTFTDLCDTQTLNKQTQDQFIYTYRNIYLYTQVMNDLQ